MQDRVFIGPDVHKAAISAAVTAGERGGEVRHWGTIPIRAEAIRKLARELDGDKLAGELDGDGRQLHFCDEAGPCGNGLHRQPTGLGHDCVGRDPSRVPVRAGAE